MKQCKLWLVVGMMLCAWMCTIPAQAQKFTARTAEGQKLHFKVLSQTNKTVALTPGKYKQSSYVIPQNVIYQGVTYTVTEIADKAFYERGSLREIKLPSTIERIGEEAFEDAKISNIVFPAQLKHISAGAFKNCRLESIVVPEGVTYIGKKAFDRNKEVLFLSLPKSLQMVGKETFYKNSSTHIASLPEMITTRNCAIYGLAKIPVQDYYKQGQTRAAASDATVQHSAADVAPAESPNVPTETTAVADEGNSGLLTQSGTASDDDEGADEGERSSFTAVEIGFMATSFESVKYSGHYGMSMAFYKQTKQANIWAGVHIYEFNFNWGLAPSSATSDLVGIGPALGTPIGAGAFVGASMDLLCDIYDGGCSWGLDLAPTVYIGRKGGLYLGLLETWSFKGGGNGTTGFRAGVFF